MDWPYEHPCLYTSDLSWDGYLQPQSRGQTPVAECRRSTERLLGNYSPCGSMTAIHEDDSDATDPAVTTDALHSNGDVWQDDKWSSCHSTGELKWETCLDWVDNLTTMCCTRDPSMERSLLQTPSHDKVTQKASNTSLMSAASFNSCWSYWSADSEYIRRLPEDNHFMRKLSARARKVLLDIRGYTVVGGDRPDDNLDMYTAVSGCVPRRPNRTLSLDDSKPMNASVLCRSWLVTQRSLPAEVGSPEAIFLSPIDVTDATCFKSSYEDCDSDLDYDTAESSLISSLCSSFSSVTWDEYQTAASSSILSCSSDEFEDDDDFQQPPQIEWNLYWKSALLCPWCTKNHYCLSEGGSPNEQQSHCKELGEVVESNTSLYLSETNQHSESGHVPVRSCESNLSSSYTSCDSLYKEKVFSDDNGAIDSRKAIPDDQPGSVKPILAETPDCSRVTSTEDIRQYIHQEVYPCARDKLLQHNLAIAQKTKDSVLKHPVPSSATCFSCHQGTCKCDVTVKSKDQITPNATSNATSTDGHHRTKMQLHETPDASSESHGPKDRKVTDCLLKDEPRGEQHRNLCSTPTNMLDKRSVREIRCYILQDVYAPLEEKLSNIDLNVSIISPTKDVHIWSDSNTVDNIHTEVLCGSGLEDYASLHDANQVTDISPNFNITGEIASHESERNDDSLASFTHSHCPKCNSLKKLYRNSNNDLSSGTCKEQPPVLCTELCESCSSCESRDELSTDDDDLQHAACRRCNSLISTCDNNQRQGQREQLGLHFCHSCMAVTRSASQRREETTSSATFVTASQGDGIHSDNNEEPAVLFSNSGIMDAQWNQRVDELTQALTEHLTSSVSDHLVGVATTRHGTRSDSWVSLQQRADSNNSHAVAKLRPNGHMPEDKFKTLFRQWKLFETAETDPAESEEQQLIRKVASGEATIRLYQEQPGPETDTK